MARLLVGLAVVGILAALLVPRPAMFGATAQAAGGPFDPLATPMARHLIQAHAIHIGLEPSDDITLNVEDDLVRVVIQDHFLQRLREDALLVLELDQPVILMDRYRYNAFLTMLHAYLTVAPPKSMPGRVPIEHEHDDLNL